MVHSKTLGKAKNDSTLLSITTLLKFKMKAQEWLYILSNFPVRYYSNKLERKKLMALYGACFNKKVVFKYMFYKEFWKLDFFFSKT